MYIVQSAIWTTILLVKIQKKKKKWNIDGPFLFFSMDEMKFYRLAKYDRLMCGAPSACDAIQYYILCDIKNEHFMATDIIIMA